MAVDERAGASKITVDVERQGIAVAGNDEPHAQFVGVGSLHAEQPASPGPNRSARAFVEVLRRFGGHAPHALLGGEFIPDRSARTKFEVNYGASDDSQCTCRSRLWNRPLSAGLPEEYSQAAMDGVINTTVGWPPGALRVDRAGFDEVESSEFAFRQTGAALAVIISAELYDRDVEAALRSLISQW